MGAFFLLFLAELVTWVAGLTPASNPAVMNLCTNAQCVTRYSFALQVAVPIPSDASVSIQFPKEFTALNLGVTTCQGFSLVNSLKVPVPCTVLDRTVTWMTGNLPIGRVDFALESVKNPNVEGGTGNFEVRTYRSAYMVEVNTAFGSVGIAPVPGSFAVSLLQTNTGVVSQAQAYVFQVTTAVSIGTGAWFRSKTGGTSCWGSAFLTPSRRSW